MDHRSPLNPEIKRAAIGKRTRFEVFKRDKFTCQYCGEKAPEVVLQVDHIHPVSKGGDNDALNLITSCQSCNGGKGAVLLSDRSALEKQREQMEALEERRQQIEMMIEWRTELASLKDSMMDPVFGYLEEKIPGRSLTDMGRKTIIKSVRKHGLEKTLEAIDISADKYLRFDPEGCATEESTSIFLSKIGGILHMKGLGPVESKLAYARAIARRRLSFVNDKVARFLVSKYAKALASYGFSDEEIEAEADEWLIPMTKESRNWTGWRTAMESRIAIIEGEAGKDGQ